MDCSAVQTGSYTGVAVARHAASSSSLSMPFGAAGVELANAVPATGAFVTTPARARKHVSLSDCGTVAPASVGGDADRQAPPSTSVSSGSVVAGMPIACDSHPRAGGLSMRAGAAVGATGAEAVDTCSTAAQHAECDREGRNTDLNPHGCARVKALVTTAAKAYQPPVIGTTQQVHPAPSTPSPSSPHFAKREDTSGGYDQLPHQRQQPVFPGSPFSGALLSTAVPVQRLYHVPSVFYAQNIVTSSVVLSAVRSHHGHSNTFTGQTTSRLSAESSARTHARLQAEASCSPGAMEALEERARRAAELHASGDVGDEAETVFTLAPESHSDEMGRTGVPAPSSLLTVQVARGYRTSGQAYELGSEEKPSVGVGDVRLVPGPKRHRRQEHTWSSANVRLGHRLCHASGHNGCGGAAASARWLASPSVSSSSSMVPASPQSPALALVSTMAPANGISATRPPVAPSPFNTLLTAFASAPSETAALASGISDPPLRTAAAQPAQMPAWVRPWLSHALSRAIAVSLVRDADAAVADGCSAGTTGQSLDSSLSVPLVASAAATATSAPVQPCTLRAALLLIFDGLERLEAEVAEVLSDGPSAPRASGADHNVRTDDHRAPPRGGDPTPCAPSPSSVAIETAADAPGRLVEQLRRLMRQWCEVLSQWPREATTLGYMEWWLGHPAWTDLVSCAATAASSTLGAFPVTPSATDRKERVRRRAEVSDGAQQRPSQQQPQAPVLVLQGALAAVVAEGMHTLLDTLVDVFVRAVSQLLRCTDMVRRPQSSTQFCSNHDAQADAAVLAMATQQRTCHELLCLLTSLYVSPPPVLQQLLTVTHGDVRSPTAATGATSKSDAPTATGREHEGSSAPPGSPPTATTAIAVGEGHQQPPHSSSSCASPRGRPPGPSLASRVGLSALDSLQSRSPVHQLHYQLLYAVCRLCNELPMFWQPLDDARDAEESKEGSGARASGADDYIDLSPRPRRNGESERAMLVLFATAARLAATVSALLLHVQLPMKGDLLCVTSRLAQWRATLLRSSCLSEREYAVAMGHLCALMAQAT
ncbi:hypothetical protein LSCM1_05943 [Leishmania martiniquensis]|uniref:Uncharacterized protein n=1 Tax=Leishmania martiniquensis TaxID=1580590 RepID=A0A836L015_9TRYP|nr:hypothetical protein LSCM1_05943 [Leishmania martiniquensis]